MLTNYFKIAWRNLIKHKASGIINILGLAIGVFSCMAIWMVTHFELSYDKFHPDKERIYRLVSEFHQRSGEVAHWGDVPEPVAAQLRVELPGIGTVADFHNYNASVSIADGHGRLKKFPKASGGQNNDDLVFAEPQYFELFKYQWVAGNPATALKEPFHVVLSTSEVQKYFGQSGPEGILGRQIIYDDSLRVTVSGIVKDWNRNTDFTFKDFISYSTIKASFVKNDIMLDQWGQFNSSSETFVRLAKGTVPSRIETELQAFASRHINSFEKDQHYRMLLQPLSDLHYSSDYDKDYGRQAHLPTLYGLLGIAAFILIIASINFINLSTAQSLQRAKEIGIRKVLGSSRLGLIVQFLGETFLLTTLALLICLLFMKPLLSSFPSFIPKEFSVNIFDSQTIGFILLILAVTTLLAGFYPGWLLSSFLPAQALKDRGSSGGSLRNRFRKGLVVLQFTISLVFIIAAIVIGNQMHFMLAKDMGFAKNAIVNFSTNGKDPANKRQLFAERIRALTGVDKVSMDWFTPAFSGAATTTIDYSNPALIRTDVNFRIADENYIPLYELKVVAGRNFIHSDTLHEVVINETYSKMLGFHNPADAIGKTINWEKPCPVVGVVSDFNIKPLRDAIGPVVIGSNAEREIGYSVKLQTQGKQMADFKNTMNRIQKCWQNIFPNEPFEYTFFDETINKFYDKEQKTAQVISTAMFIAIFISCMGLFGLVALIAEKRRKEIGIRKVLGASVTGIVSLLSKDFLKLIFISILIASPAAWYFMHQWLQDFAYKVPISWWMFVLAGSGAIIIALLTVSFQAIRAAIANPVKSLKTE